MPALLSVMFHLFIVYWRCFPLLHLWTKSLKWCDQWIVNLKDAKGTVPAGWLRKTTKSLSLQLLFVPRLELGISNTKQECRALSHLGGVVVSVLTTGLKGRGLDGFLTAIQIRSTPSFGWEVKPDVPCRKIYGMLKIPWGISDADMQNSHSFFHSSYLPQMSLVVGLPESSGGRVRSYPQPASSPWLFTLAYHPGDEQ
jgi:hypothetical protein